MAQFDTDYLIVGAGASGLSFADSLLTETDAHITIVDKRDKPGGHWNDAYPFVRLHQPSSFYGVSSRALGRDHIDQNGTNKGYFELASGTDVAGYFHAVMKEQLLASGRVRYLPMTDHVGDGVVRGVLSGDTTEIRYKRLVDARMCENGIPLSHTRAFDVTPNVTCIPPNFLPRMAGQYSRFTILGAGKTAMDTAVWLLEHGAEPDQMRWVVPRDPWMINRAVTQPSGAFFHQSAGNFAKQIEALAKATSAEDFANTMGDLGIWLRLDPDVTPEIMHGPTISEAELALLQQIRDVVRLGHVKTIEPDTLILAQGHVAAQPQTLYIDCTARALGHTNTWPIFDDTRIGLQMIRLYQPTFSGALLAKIEATLPDNRSKNAVAVPVPMTDTVQGWIRSQGISLMNQFGWTQNDSLRNWIKASRLDGFGRPGREVDRTDPTVIAVGDTIRQWSGPALQNAQKIASH